MKTCLKKCEKVEWREGKRRREGEGGERERKQRGGKEESRERRERAGGRGRRRAEISCEGDLRVHPALGQVEVEVLGSEGQIGRERSNRHGKKLLERGWAGDK